jgi:hypothetical protein
MRSLCIIPSPTIKLELLWACTLPDGSYSFWGCFTILYFPVVNGTIGPYAGIYRLRSLWDTSPCPEDCHHVFLCMFQQ